MSNVFIFRNLAEKQGELTIIRPTMYGGIKINKIRKL